LKNNGKEWEGRGGECCTPLFILTCSAGKHERGERPRVEKHYKAVK